MTDKKFSKDVTIVNKRGLHARASAKLAKTVADFNCTINIIHHQNTACAKDILELLTLAASQGSIVTVVTYNGTDAEKALRTTVDLIENGFEEDKDLNIAIN